MVVGSGHISEGIYIGTLKTSSRFRFSARVHAALADFFKTRRVAVGILPVCFSSRCLTMSGPRVRFSMNILILTIGTRGDVQPHIALGVGLSDAGHDVTICTSPRYHVLFENRGPAFALLNDDIVALVESAEGRAAIEDMSSLISGLTAATRLLLRHGDIQRELVRDAWTATADVEPDAIVYHPKMACGLHFAEKLEIPAVIAPLYPLFLPTSAYPNVGLAPLHLGASLTGTFNRVTHRVVRSVVRGISTRYFSDWRSEHSLPPLPRGHGILRDANGRPASFMNAWSEHVASNPDDWPRDVETTGYWFLDSRPDWTPSPDLAAFLDAGPPPVYIGFGSMASRHPERTTQLVLDAVAQSGCRAILASGWGGLTPDDVPDSVFRLDGAPHDRLFPRCAAVVHHGGAGTTAAGLRAGRPTVICPFFGDQPFWGRRVHELGAGPEPIPQKKLTASGLASAIRAATETSSIRQSARELGRRIRDEDGIGRALHYLTNLVSSSSR